MTSRRRSGTAARFPPPAARTGGCPTEHPVPAHPRRDGLGHVVGSAAERADRRQQRRGVLRGLEEPGNDCRAVRLEEPGPLVQRAPDSCARRMPARLSRRHSTYIESAARDAAIRSGTSRSAPQTRHQAWMSASLGACLADSIRLVFAACQPAAADSARAVRPASRRMSRSRSASCCRARWTLDDGEMATPARQARPVVGVRDRTLPDGLERRGHMAATAGSATSRPPRFAVAGEVVEPDEPVSNSQKSFPGRHRSDARRRGSQRTSSPAATFTLP